MFEPAIFLIRKVCTAKQILSRAFLGLHSLRQELLCSLIRRQLQSEKNLSLHHQCIAARKEDAPLPVAANFP